MSFKEALRHAKPTQVIGTTGPLRFGKPPALQPKKRMSVVRSMFLALAVIALVYLLLVIAGALMAP